MSELSSIKSQALTERIEERLFAYILDKHLKVGAKLPNENELAAHFEVSRGTVREAVKLLVSRGVLRVKHGSGTYVASLFPLHANPLGLDAVEDKHGGWVAVLPAPRPARRIPLFASPAAAGYASPVLGEEYEMIDAGGEDAAQFAVRICGDSMEPHIPDGSIVYVGREPLQNGDVGIFCVDGDTFCKQYYKDALGIVYLFSLNRARADADVALPPSSGRTLACFGRVLLKRRFPLPAGAR